MTREEVEQKVNAAIEYDDSYDLRDIILEFLDDVESRTCENCEYWNKTNNIAVSFDCNKWAKNVMTQKDFGCNKFERKINEDN